MAKLSRRRLCWPLTRRWWRHAGIRTKAAVAGTVLWLSFWVYYIFVRYTWTDLWAVSPNQIGDFLAGTVAPLAFLWLILGYLQQSDELRLQRKELALQRREVAFLGAETGKQRAALEASERHARQDAFMRLAELTTNELVELAALLSTAVQGVTNPRDLWEQYSKGNKNIFFIHIIDRGLTHDHAHFQSVVSGSAPYREYAVRYIGAFDGLMYQAVTGELSENLVGQFEYSPMGTVYAGLCLAIGELISFEQRTPPKTFDDLT